MANELCSICESGYLCSHIEKIEVDHMEQVGLIESHYSVCSACGSEQATTTNTACNKLAMIKFKKMCLSRDQFNK